LKEYTTFLDGEAQLELYLQQYPLTDCRHIEHARQVLVRVENVLKSVGSSHSFEVECLLAKLYYAQARYDECLINVDLAINSFPNDINEQPHRSSLLLSEIYALKGLLLEKKDENLLEMIKAFDDSCKLSKTYYVAVEKAKHLSNDNLDIENSLIEIAYQRLPLLHASNK
jgi:tetratricopeptide (TPR) repeat protein